MKTVRSVKNVSSPIATVGDAHPILGPLVMETMKITKPPADKVAPSQSNDESFKALIRGFSINITTATTVEIAPSTDEVKKTQRQPRTSTMIPPRTGPTIAPTPTTLIKSPNALPRSDVGNADISIAMELPWVIAEPTPWMIRNKIK